MMIRPSIDQLERRTRDVSSKHVSSSPPSTRARKTYLERIDANIIPLIDVRRYVQLVQSLSDHIGIRSSFEGESWDNNAVISIPQILRPNYQNSFSLESG